MYSGGILQSSEMELWSGCRVAEVPGIRKKEGQWETTRVRWPSDSLGGSVWQFVRRRTTIVNNRCIVQRGSAFLNGENFPAGSTIGPHVTELMPRGITGTETNAQHSAKLIEPEDILKNLPQKVSPGLVLESLGTVYRGPHEERYWRESRCGHRHPYPVGYTATKTYKGVHFKQKIGAGPDGPRFLVGEVNGDLYEADSASKAWSMALVNSQLNCTTRIHGRKHFGFECPVVSNLLTYLEKEQVYKTGVDESNVEVGKSSRIEKDDGEQTVGVDWNGQTSSLELRSIHHIESNHAKNPQAKIETHFSLAEQVKTLTHKASSPGLSSGSLIRLRSDLVDKDFCQKVPILSCLQQDSTRPGTRVYFQESFSKLDDLEDTMITGTLPSKNIPPNEVTKSYQYNSGSGFERKKDVGMQSVDHGGVLEDSSWNPEVLDKMIGESTAEKGILMPKNFTSRLLNPSIQRSRISFEDPGSRAHARTRSLASLLEDWNKGERSKSVLNPKSRVGQGDFKVVDKVLSINEEDNRSLIETSGSLYGGDKDIQRRVHEWCSGEKGQLSVLNEIQQLVVNLHVDQAVEVLRQLHSSGNHLDDKVYSVFFPFTFEEWQNQAVEQVKESSVLVCAPGSAGKFTVAAHCFYQALVQGERCLFVTPYEALAKDRLQQFQKLFGSKNVGMFSKAVDGWQHSITVMTIETLVKELRDGGFSGGSDGKHSGGLHLAVMDRFHTLGAADYGSLWEEVFILMNPQVKVLALSLPMKASHDVVSWISLVHSQCSLVSCKFESVPKSYFYCDTSGLHVLPKSDQGDHPSSSPKHQFEDSFTIEGDSMTSLQISLRGLLQSLQTENLLPIAISFSSIEDCIASLKVANEMIDEQHISQKEVAIIKERLQSLFRENVGLERIVSKDDTECLLRGFALYHDCQLPLWLEFVQGLIYDKLVKIVLATNTMLLKTRISVSTIALSLPSGKSYSSSELILLLSKAGHRGQDSYGKVVFIGSKHSWQRNMALDSQSALSIHSYFEPSYSLLLNLLSRHTLPEVRKLVESNYGDYLAKKLRDEELKKLEEKVSEVKEQKKNLEANLFQKLSKMNSVKLQDATIFTQVDVRVSSNGLQCTDGILPGVLIAVLPGPTELLYVILCADNNFRLLPACALDHVYTEERRLDVIYERITGDSLRPPPSPSKDKWKISPGEYLAYISEGTAETAHVVEVLLRHGAKFRGAEEEQSHREEIGSCNGLLSSLLEQQKSLILSRPATTWTKSQRLIEVLEKADALELSSSDVTYAQLKPLGILISRFHHVENELWFAMALSSSVVKPLTAPELAGICSALVYTSEKILSGISESKNLNKSASGHDPPKRLRAALEKLENLRKQVETLQGSVTAPLRLDGSAVAAVHSLSRETEWKDPDGELKRDWIVLVVLQTVKLLHLVDEVWVRSTDLLSALGTTSALHNVARRAAHMLEKVIISGR